MLSANSPGTLFVKKILIVAVSALTLVWGFSRILHLIQKSDSDLPLLSKGWKYTNQEPAKNWVDQEFDDSKWSLGVGPFGRGYAGEKKPNTQWTTSDIWLRNTFKLNQIPQQDLYFSLFHDEDIEIFLNGVKVITKGGYTGTFIKTKMDSQMKNLLRAGVNVLAVHCTNKAGPGLVQVMIEK